MKVILSFSFLLFYVGSFAQTELWRHSDTLGGIYAAVGINIDINDNLYVAGPAIDSLDDSAVSAALVFKLDNAGNYRWNQGFIYNHTIGYGGMAGDSAGNSYLYGVYVDSASDNAFLTRVDSSGNMVWTKHYNYGGIYDDFESAMVDNNGNILVAGVTDNSEQGQDMTSLKFSPADTVPIWSTLFADTYGYYYSISAQTDRAGGEYNVGQTFVTDYGASMFILKYNSVGANQWEKLLNSTPYSDEEPVSSNSDAAGNLYVADNSSPSYTNFNYVPYALKLGPGGNIVWKTLLAADTNVDYILNASALDAEGFYMAGSRDDSIYVIKFSATTGDTLWTFQYKWGSIYKIIVKNNAVYATGFINDLAGSTNDFFTVKLTPNGLMLWNATYNGNMNGSDIAHDLVADNSGNIYVAGQSFELPSNNGSATVIKYYDTSSNCALVINSIATTATNNDSTNGSAIAVIAGGTSPFTFQWSNGAVTDTISRVGVNNYCVTITDAHGCIANLCDSVLPVPCNLSVNSVIYSDASCFGNINGSITVYRDGGIGQVLYSIDSGAHFQADSAFGSLGASINYVEVKDANNCTAVYSSNPVPINAAPADTPTLAVTSDTLSAGQYRTYNWYLNGSIVNTKQFLVLDSNSYCGDIYVQVMDPRGCIYNSSGYENVCTGINSLNNAALQLTVYPNPFTERLNGSIDGTLVGKAVQLTLFDVYGRKLYEDKLAGNTFSIPTSALPAGMYLISLQAGETFIYKQVIKAGGE